MLNKLSATLATTAFVLGASTAVAQSIPFAEVDTNSDMMLSNEELVAAFGENGAMILMEDDSDGDGMLSVQEIRIATSPMGDTATMGDTSKEPEARAESDDTEDPDYRDTDETTLQPNETETEGFVEEEEDMDGNAGDEDDGQ